MADPVYVKGLSDLQRVLDTLPPKLEKNVMRGALRAGISVIQPVARANIHSRSGELAKGLKIKTRSLGGTVVARLVATGKHAFVALWVEFGTAAHSITGKAGGFLSFFGVFAKSVMHPGAAKKPFMRPAMDSQSQAAVVAVGNYIKDRLAKKEGLDTSYIAVEGDEG